MYPKYGRAMASTRVLRPPLRVGDVTDPVRNRGTYKRERQLRTRGGRSGGVNPSVPPARLPGPAGRSVIEPGCLSRTWQLGIKTATVLASSGLHRALAATRRDTEPATDGYTRRRGGGSHCGPRFDSGRVQRLPHDLVPQAVVAVCPGQDKTACVRVAERVDANEQVVKDKTEGMRSEPSPILDKGGGK